MKKKTSFENDLHRLAEITDEVEDGQTTLETAIALYKEGLKLAEKCANTLAKYEEEVMTLQKNAEGILALKPFAAGEV